MGALAVSLWLAGVGPVTATPVIIVATLPATDELPAAIEKLREAVRLAGCEESRVAMVWRGGERGVEVEVTCRSDEQRGDPWTSGRTPNAQAAER